jgi:hypothetical protein
MEADHSDYSDYTSPGKFVDLYVCAQTIYEPYGEGLFESLESDAGASTNARKKYRNL